MEIVITIFIIILLYLIYQLFRNHKIYKIRCNWSNTDNNRWYKYSYNEMFNPSKSNWFGLLYPRNKHFK